MRTLLAFAAMLAVTLATFAVFLYGYRYGTAVFGWPPATSFLDLFWPPAIAVFCGQLVFSAFLPDRPKRAPSIVGLLVYIGIAAAIAVIAAVAVSVFTSGGDNGDMPGFVILAALAIGLGAGDLALDRRRPGRLLDGISDDQMCCRVFRSLARAARHRAGAERGAVSSFDL